jgi:hypothetical protein
MTESRDLYIEYVPLQELRKLERNPKLHSPDIEKSYERYGYVDPVIIDEGSGKLVAGHGRVERLETMQEEGKSPPDRIKMDSTGAWLVPVIRGVAFKSEEQAEEFGVTSNALVIEGGFDEAELEYLISEVGIDPIGVDLERDVQDVISEVDQEAKATEVHAERENAPSEDNQAGEVDTGGSQAPEPDHEKKLDDQQTYDQLPFELEGVYELSEEAYWLPEDDDFAMKCLGSIIRTEDSEWLDIPGANSIGIPNLRPDRLVQELPKNLTTWGDRQSTPDDGKSWYFFNYGAAPHRGLPLDRAIFSFFTHDQHIETWWATPAYRVGQILRAGVKNIVVPDYSLWDFSPTAAHIWSIYRSMWLGRYFQEAGLNVIPRIEFFQPKSQHFTLMGIPYDVPIVATQFQTEFDEENVPSIERNLRDALKLIRAKHLLVYAGKKGRAMVEKFDLPCDLTVLKTSSEFRKKEARIKETDPHLLELRKRRRGRETKRATTPEK